MWAFFFSPCGRALPQLFYLLLNSRCQEWLRMWIWVRKGGWGSPVTTGLNYGPTEIKRWLDTRASKKTRQTDRDAQCAKTCRTKMLLLQIPLKPGSGTQGNEKLSEIRIPSPSLVTSELTRLLGLRKTSVSTFNGTASA